LTVTFTPVPTKTVRACQAGGPDAHGQPPEHHVSDGDGYPCRHCLRMIPAGAGVLVLAHRPFPGPQPYAEVGPVFLCAHPCPAGGGPAMPEILISPVYIVRGCPAEHRIVYDTGAVVPLAEIPGHAAARLDDPRIDYLHVRSASNTCYHLRIDRV